MSYLQLSQSHLKWTDGFSTSIAVNRMTFSYLIVFRYVIRKTTVFNRQNLNLMQISWTPPPFSAIWSETQLMSCHMT